MHSESWGCDDRRVHLTNVHTHTYIYTPHSPSGLNLFSIRGKKTNKKKKLKTKRQSLASTQGARGKELTNRMRQKLCPLSVESPGFSALLTSVLAWEESGAAGKGKRSNLARFAPLEGTLRLWAALTVRIGARRAGVWVRVAVVVLGRALFPQSPLDGSETGQQTLVVKTTSLLTKRILQEI